MTAAKKLNLYEPAQPAPKKEHHSRRYGRRHDPVLKALLGSHLTDHELAGVLNTDQESARRLRGELTRIGYVESAGEGREAPSHRMATVWRLTTQGAEKAKSL